jgi:SAM-dependent methyltransferase
MTHPVDERRLYRDLAWVFPIVTPLEDYLEETELFVQTIREHARTPVETLLHLGSGGGHNDFVFKRHFRVTGLDASDSMLELARALNPEVSYLRGDIRTTSLGRTFDVIAAVDSLQYLTTPEDWRAVCRNAFAHLNPGGVFLFLLEQTTECFRHDTTTVSAHHRGGVHVTFIENLYDPDPGKRSYEATFVYLIRRDGRQEVHTDVHQCGVFAVADVETFVRDAGFDLVRLTYSPPDSAIEHSGLTGQERFPMFLCLKPLDR